MHTPHINNGAFDKPSSADADSHHNGITLEGVKELHRLVVRYNSDNPADRIVITANVANKIVKPRTVSLPKGKQAYVHLDGGKHRGKPKCFVSHTWQADAIGLLETIIRHGEAEVRGGRPAPIYYLDLASVDQHQTDQVRSLPQGIMLQRHRKCVELHRHSIAFHS